MYDLNDAIMTMNGIFPEENCPMGGEHGPFCSHLESIVEQMERLAIHQDYHISVLYALLLEEARKACKNLKLSLITLEEMIDEVIKKIMFEDEMKGLRFTRWATVEFQRFRQITDNKEKVKNARSLSLNIRKMSLHTFSPENIFIIASDLYFAL